MRAEHSLYLIEASAAEEGARLCGTLAQVETRYTHSSYNGEAVKAGDGSRRSRLVSVRCTAGETFRCRIINLLKFFGNVDVTSNTPEEPRVSRSGHNECSYLLNVEGFRGNTVNPIWDQCVLPI